MKPAGKILFAILVSMLALQTGCTVSLWKETSHWDAHKIPAQPNHLQVFEDSRQQDFLVVFNQLSERTDSDRTRAYFLYANEGRIEQRRRPHFVSIQRAKDLKPVPVVQPDETLPAQKPYVIASTNDCRFTLHAGSGETTSHLLPFYRDGIGQAERIVLTPVTVTVDAAMIGAIIFVEAAAHGNWSCDGP
jgi:hypothetical protein